MPQSSNSGPILFLLFINDLTGIFNFNCEKLLFTDDLKFYSTVALPFRGQNSFLLHVSKYEVITQEGFHLFIFIIKLIEI